MHIDQTSSRALVGNLVLKRAPQPDAKDQFLKHLDAAKAKPFDIARPDRPLDGGPVRLHPKPVDRPTDQRPLDRVDYAQQHVKEAMQQLETNIGKALHRLGFDRGEIKRITHHVMDSIQERVKHAASKLGEAKHPIRAAHNIVDKAVDAVGHRLAKTLHGLGFERPVIAKVIYHVTNGLDRA